MRKNKQWCLAAGVIVVVVAVLAGLSSAQAPVEQSPVDAEAKEISLWNTVRAGGMIGLLIVCMSLVSIALVVEHFLSIRRERIVPAALIDEVEDSLEAKNYDGAKKTCGEDDSFVAKVIGAGLSQIGAMFGFFDMQNAMQEISEREISKLYRKLEYLAFIAATAPMLGLLGTVTGMISSFNTIAATEGTAKPSQLAGGISEALVTTCMGLIVAIPTMFFVSFFRNRIDGFVAEMESVVEKVMGRFRRQTT